MATYCIGKCGASTMQKGEEYECDECWEKRHLNIVTCGNCGEIFGHKLGVTELHCPYCPMQSDVCDFPDLYYMPEHEDSLINILK